MIRSSKRRANRIALELEDWRRRRFDHPQRVTELRFGSSFTEEAFAEHLDTNGQNSSNCTPSQ